VHACSIFSGKVTCRSRAKCAAITDSASVNALRSQYHAIMLLFRRAENNASRCARQRESICITCYPLEEKFEAYYSVCLNIRRLLLFMCASATGRFCALRPIFYFCCGKNTRAHARTRGRGDIIFGPGRIYGCLREMSSRGSGRSCCCRPAT